MDQTEFFRLFVQLVETGTEEEIRAFLDSIDKDTYELIQRHIYSASVVKQEDTPRAFQEFYRLVYRRMLPDFALYEWIIPLFVAFQWLPLEKAHAYYQKAPDNWKNFLDNLLIQYPNLGNRVYGVHIEAFRGSTKTTTLTALTAYALGKHPEQSSLLVQVGDDIANDNTEAVTDIIANNPGWKLAFPSIEPDKEKGWGASGYEIKDTSLEYPQWREKNAARKDASLLGVGYKSRAIIGKHPGCLLCMDDIHDENNTSSTNERQNVINIVTGTIFPTLTEPSARAIMIGTPWTEDDAGAYVDATGEFITVKTPVLRFDEHGPHSFEGQPCALTWPSRFTEEEINKQKKLAGEREFARMFLLDLEAANIDGVHYLPYPAEKFDPFVSTVAGGMDAAFVYEERKLTEKDRSNAAIIYIGKAVDLDCLVIFGGWVKRAIFSEVERNLWNLQNMYPKTNRGTWFETAGRGQDQYYSTALRNPGLNIIPSGVAGNKVGAKVSKERRHEVELFPWFDNGKIRVSDANTPIMDQIRAALKKWPYGDLNIIDAIYMGVKAFPEVLVIHENTSEHIPSPHKVTQQARSNPWAKTFGKVNHYAR